MAGLGDFVNAPAVPGAPGGPPAPAPGGDPGSFADYGNDAQNAGKAVAAAGANQAKNDAMNQGADMANDLIQDAKNGNPPDPGAIKDRALGAAKDIAHNTGAAALDAAKQAATAQVDKTLAIIGNEFPMLGGILGILSKPIIDHALNQAQMPDF